jgi:hypothetical protein
MPQEKQYYWIVICKNRRFHAKQNRLFGHPIPLAETDFYSIMPALESCFSVQCDECGKDYAYCPSDVMRLEMYPVEWIFTHPLFR